jgi:hypothetical protein
MNKVKTIDDLMNDITFYTTYNRLKNIAFNMFTWEGLPDGIKPQYIERLLFSQGKAIFVKDPNLKHICLQANPSDGLNVYGEYQNWYAWGSNGYNEKYGIDECVIIRNNMLMTNTKDQILIYSNKLTDIERTMDVNVKAQKTPKIIACDDKDILTFKNMIKQIDDNFPSIYASKQLNINAIQVLDTNSPYVVDKLTDYRHDVTNEALTFLGINNSNTDKKERLVTNEVDSNNEYIECNIGYMLESREKACIEINKMFSLNISVKAREVQENGPIHNGSKGNSENK